LIVVPSGGLLLLAIPAAAGGRSGRTLSHVFAVRVEATGLSLILVVTVVVHTSAEVAFDLCAIVSMAWDGHIGLRVLRVLSDV